MGPVYKLCNGKYWVDAWTPVTPTTTTSLLQGFLEGGPSACHLPYKSYVTKLRRDIDIDVLSLAHGEVSWCKVCDPKLTCKYLYRYESAEVALNCGMMLRECLRHEPLARTILFSEEFDCFFRYVELSTFDIASDAFASFKVHSVYFLWDYRITVLTVVI